MTDLSMEWNIEGHVVGVDEAGAGPLAGPVVAAAVIIPNPHLALGPLKGVTDSKKLSASRRMSLREAIKEHCTVSVGAVTPEEIDAMNILKARLLAMVRAVSSLPTLPQHALIDGHIVPKGLPCPATAVVKGDAISLSIAAASIIAKTERDMIMEKLDRDFPGYGWARNSGYPTAEHKDAIRRLGITPHHRLTFAGLGYSSSELQKTRQSPGLQ